MRIELHDVCKDFDGTPVLDRVSLTVPSGDRVGLVGPNGSGKSTLVRAVMGMVRCDGRLRLDDCDPFTHRAQLASRMAYVPQAAPQLGATVAEVVQTVAELRNVRPRAIGAVAAELDLDVDAIGRRPVRALSGGMKQKLLIALALASPVSLLIMDEPTASLDAPTRDVFFQLLDRHAADATLLFSSHRPDDVGRVVDRVVVLEAGHLVDSGLVAPAVSTPHDRSAPQTGRPETQEADACRTRPRPS
jgi:ABC-type multidrug transport system ATPase subunit